MTYFLNFRSKGVGGATVDPYLLQGEGTSVPPALSVVDPMQLPQILAGKNLLFTAHGFNVDYQDGACALGMLDEYLALPSSTLFIGLLWPGDSWLPIVDYPFEGDVAADCGRRLAVFCNEYCMGAQSISFASHSLGARLILEATARLGRTARSVCLTAAAINRDCLTRQYAAAAGNAERITILASGEDSVLKLAFSIGDPFADLLHDDHTPFQAALGTHGPPAPPPDRVLYPWQIPDAADYGHHDYLPPSPAVALPPAPAAKWPNAADFVKRAFLGQPQVWPTG